MTASLRARIQTAAFWSEGLCLKCLEVVPAEEDECPECGEGPVVPAGTVAGVLARIEEEDGLTE